MTHAAWRVRRAAVIGGVATGLVCAVFVVAVMLSGRQAAVAPGSASSPVPSPSAWPDVESSSAVFPGGLWTNPDSQAALEEKALRVSGRVAAAAAIGTIAAEPVATWLTGATSGARLTSMLAAAIGSARKSRTTPVFVTYAIPDRDCGDYSSGGAANDKAYLRWNRTIISALRGSSAVVLVEPDSIAMLGRASCTSVTTGRLALLRTVTKEFAAAKITAYLDGGNSHWQSAGLMATRLREAGVADARGFFTNVSNFYRVDDERSYAERLSALIGGKHFVIDVSRDGAGPKGSWCNPTGAALGQDPHVAAGTGGLDALLWVKTPGASDGTCNGGPTAGRWFESYALALVADRGSGQ